MRLLSILKIFADDIKSVSKHLFVLAILVVISILPALYAWINIYANGDPYAHTGNIKVAVASYDKGIKLEDGQFVNVSDEVIAGLKENKAIGWQFPKTPEEAIKGVESGKYYAAVIFEDNLTNNMYHFEQALLDKKAPLTYYENSKKNAIASKITQTAAETVQSSLNKKYLENVFGIVFDKVGSVAPKIEDFTEDSADAILVQLSALKDALDAYDKSITTFIDNNAGIKQSVKDINGKYSESSKNKQSHLYAAQRGLNEASSAISRFRSTFAERIAAVDSRITEIEKIVSGIGEPDPATAEQINNVRTRVSEIVSMLENIRSTLPADNSIEGSDAAISAIDRMLDRVKTFTTDFENLPVNREHLVAGISYFRNMENNTLKPTFEIIMDNVENTVKMLGPFLADVYTVVDNVGPVLSATGETMDSLDTSLAHLQTAIRSASSRLGDIIEKVENADENERLALLMDLLNGDSEKYSAFFSSLVNIETEEIYTVASYGAAMTPFYSILAIWVSGVILASMIKTRVDREKFPGLRETQYFFGRYLTFFLFGQIQAAIIVAGDIFLLKCSPVHPWLMWLSAAVTSAVFVLFIYAMALSFGYIGKAIVVILMVLQIAGSSGTYPIEILPPIFGKIYKFFPFPYAIDAMRETISGIYGNHFLVRLLELSVYAVIGLIIGLIIRRPFMGLHDFVEEEIEETEVL